jgi:hypothetical protein
MQNVQKPFKAGAKVVDLFFGSYQLFKFQNLTFQNFKTLNFLDDALLQTGNERQ